MFLIKCLRLLEIHHFVGVSNNVYFCNLDRKKTPVACLKNQGSWGENQHVPSNKKVVFDQEMPASACSDVQVSIVQLFIHDDMFIFSVFQPIILFLFVLLILCIMHKMKLTDLCLGKQPVGQPKKQISPHKKCQSATKSPGTRSPDSYVSEIFYSLLS